MKLTAQILLSVLAAAALGPTAHATTITVDLNGQGDYSSIFSGIYWSAAGDTVLVYPGVYTGAANRNLILPARDFTLMSRDGPETTILDLEGSPGITCTPGQTVDMLIEGFTFTSGDAPFSDYGVWTGDYAGCTVRNCTFDDRTSLEVRDAGNMAVEGCTFTRNDRGIEIYNPAQVTVRNCAFRSNRTGVGLYSLSTPAHIVSIIGCDFDSNTLGVSLSTAGHVLVDSCSFANATNGAYSWQTAMSINLTTQTFADVRIRHCSFTGNHSNGSAAAIEATAYDGSVLVDDCVFTGNSAAGAGGAIWSRGYHYSQGGPVVIDNCIFADNLAEGAGGAICNAGRHLTVSECSFLRNTGESGGAIYISEESSAGETSITDCVFVDNEAADGGAIAATHQLTRITECEFTGNTAERGAAVFSVETLNEITDCLFAGNRAHMWGGGVCVVDTPLPPGIKIYGCTFDGNRSHRGAAVMFDYSLGTIHGCTLFGNSSEDASITSTRASRTEVEECIVSFATAGTPVAGQLLSRINVTNCLVFGNKGGDSLTGDLVYEYDNLYTDPLLCDVSSGDFTLCANSMCLPANNPWAVAIGAHGEGCDPCDTPVELRSWGSIKAMFR